jgi:hypothetical protein
LIEQVAPASAVTGGVPIQFGCRAVDVAVDDAGVVVGGLPGMSDHGGRV